MEIQDETLAGLKSALGRIEEKYQPALLGNFPWSEKLKASGILAHKFQNRFLDNEKLGDLWLMAGNKEKTKSAYFSALNHYKKEQFTKTFMSRRRIL